MPKINPLTSSERLDKQITVQLVGRMKTEKVNSEKMASMMGVSLKTFYRKRDNPEMLTLRDIRAIKEVFPDMRIE